MKVALSYERAAKLAMRGELTEAQARKVLNDILEQTGTGDTLRAPSVTGWLKQWLDAKEACKSAGTAIRYGEVVSAFEEHLGDRAKRPLTSVAPRDIQAFITARLKEGIAATTATTDVKILRNAFNVARRHGIISTNPVDSVELPKCTAIERGTFTSAEVKVLLDAAEGEWKTLILIGYFTGARLGDCCAMEWDNVDLANGALTFTQTKTGKPLVIPLHPDLLKHLEALATGDSAQKYVMPGMSEQGPGGRHGLSEGFKRIVGNAGLDLQTVQGGGKRQICRRTFHALRHSFTSALANAGVSPELRMKLTGHKSAAVHAGYSHMELETLRAAVGKLPVLGL
jgi:integrase